MHLYDEVCDFTKREGVFPQLRNTCERARLSFLADLYSHLNRLNTTMQGRHLTIVNCKIKIEAFIQKLAIFKSSLQFLQFEGFPNLAKCTDIVSQEDLHLFTDQIGNLSIELLERYAWLLWR